MTVLHLRGFLHNLEVKDCVKGMDYVNLMALFILINFYYRGDLL